jgi:sugar transferase (PEP-CTERM/EpsH1 system associated)
VTAHIVHVVHRFDTGGMENGMVNLFNALSPERYRHTVVALTDFGDFRHRITAQRVDFHALHRAPGHGLGWAVRLWKLLRQLKPDLVHTRNLAALEAQFVAAAAGIRRTVHGEHGRDVFDLYGRNWKYNLLRRAARPFVSNYIAVSQDLETWLRLAIRVPPRKLHHIYNGVDSEKFRPRTGPRPDFAHPESIVFGSVGRMVAVKDYPTLTAAFIQLMRQQPDRSERARLVIVGDGPARATCLDLLQGAGLAHLAWLPGERHDIRTSCRCSTYSFSLPKTRASPIPSWKRWRAACRWSPRRWAAMSNSLRRASTACWCSRATSRAWHRPCWVIWTRRHASPSTGRTRAGTPSSASAFRSWPRPTPRCTTRRWERWR